ncbi:MAG: hypothetical protein HOI70_12400 [Opitutae bacterium]|nr:hypothetical protein [Opitutae bacterium]
MILLLEIFGSVEPRTLQVVAIVLLSLFVILSLPIWGGGKDTKAPRARKPKQRREVSSKKKRGKSKSVGPCPLCHKEYGGFLIIKQNSKNNSKFLGCTRYRKCKYKRGYRDHQR